MEKFLDVLPIILLAMSQLMQVVIIMDLNRRTKMLEKKVKAIQDYIYWEQEDEYAEGPASRSPG